MVAKERKVVYRGHHENHLVEVIDQGDERFLLFGGNVVQSSMSIQAPELLTLSYTRYMMAPLLLNNAPQKVLVVGLGAGSLLRFINYHFPDCLIDAVDNVAHIINVSREYFHLPDKPEISIHCCDGFDFLADLAQDFCYDLILVDAFDATGMSVNVYRAEFFDLCRDHLVYGGVISLNLWSGERERLEEVIEDIGSRFSSIVEIPVPKRGNVICIGRNDEPIWPLLKKNRADLRALSDRFSINFKSVINQSLKRKLTLFQRFSHYFH